MSSQHNDSWLKDPPLDPDGTPPEPPPAGTTVAHSARRYDYWLGGCFP